MMMTIISSSSGSIRPLGLGGACATPALDPHSTWRDVTSDTTSPAMPCPVRHRWMPCMFATQRMPGSCRIPPSSGRVWSNFTHKMFIREVTSWMNVIYNEVMSWGKNINEDLLLKVVSKIIHGMFFLFFLTAWVSKFLHLPLPTIPWRLCYDVLWIVEYIQCIVGLSTNGWCFSTVPFACNVPSQNWLMMKSNVCKHDILISKSMVSCRLSQ